MDNKTTEETITDSSSTAKDSLTVIPVKKTVEYVPSLFKNHLLTTTQLKPQIHITNHDYVNSSVLLVLFVCFVWLYKSSFKAINQVTNDFFQLGYGTNQSREVSAIGNRANIFMSLFFIVTLSILIGRILDYYGLKFFSVNVPDEIIIGILIVVMYAVKFMIITFVGFVLKLQKETAFYFHQVASYCNSLGLFLLPIIILLSFFKQAPPFIFMSIGVILVAAFLLIRMFNGLVFGLNNSKISKFYLFIYLCALEILPLIIIAKLIILRIY
jgi:hypothetical protein